MSELLLDRAGRRRSPATMPRFHAGHAPANEGLSYPADPPKVEEIIAVMRASGDAAHGRRLRGLIVTSASAAPPVNYGHCVSGGTVSPSEENTGPANSNAAVMPSAAVHAYVMSNGNSRFPFSEACIK